MHPAAVLISAASLIIVEKWHTIANNASTAFHNSPAYSPCIYMYVYLPIKVEAKYIRIPLQKASPGSPCRDDLAYIFFRILNLNMNKNQQSDICASIKKINRLKHGFSSKFTSYNDAGCAEERNDPSQRFRGRKDMSTSVLNISRQQNPGQLQSITLKRAEGVVKGLAQGQLHLNSERDSRGEKLRSTCSSTYFILSSTNLCSILCSSLLMLAVYLLPLTAKRTHDGHEKRFK